MSSQDSITPVNPSIKQSQSPPQLQQQVVDNCNANVDAKSITNSGDSPRQPYLNSDIMSSSCSSSPSTSSSIPNRCLQQSPQPKQQQRKLQQNDDCDEEDKDSPNNNNKNNSKNSNNNDTNNSYNNPWDLSQEWFDSISRQLIEHMTQFGICVIDNFLGLEKGRSIFNEVEELYSSRKYSNGSLVGSDKFSNENSSADPGAIRNDRVIWVDGKETNCCEINNLIQTLSSVITNSSTLSLYSNNELDKIVINKRTKAHVSCYPGNGTRYVKHVDNPNRDGRLITAIYYLNENWNTKREGGLLRMFPTGTNQVANIEPLFDRALFFWSDRRNPHEVLPAYRDRYAITVWFMGDKRP